jgi:hypothetical protein
MPVASNGTSKYYEFVNANKNKLDTINSANIMLNIDNKNKIIATSNHAIAAIHNVE